MRRLTLGRVAGVYGVKGWVKLLSFSRPVGELLEYRSWWIDRGEGFESHLVEGRLHGHGIVAQITGPDGEPVTDRDVAASMIGAELQVERSRLPPPPEGQYYWADLVGVRVGNCEGDALGVVEGVTSNGAQDVLVVKQDKLERLIPFVKGAIVKSVSLNDGAAEGLIVVDWQPDY